jgi:hypothetical protein
MTMQFNGPDQLHFGVVLCEQPNQLEIRALPQFFRADFDMVYRQGGSILRACLEELPVTGKFRYLTIDTRTHLLMPRMYPCLPGWHCDDFYRRDGDQPDLEHVMDEAPSLHHSVVFGATAFTEYVTTPLELPAPRDLPNPDGEALYMLYHRLIERQRPATRQVQSGEVVTFGPLAFHRGTAATQTGWRYFLRLTESNHWEPLNEIRTQTQVYLTESYYQW